MKEGICEGVKVFPSVQSPVVSVGRNAWGKWSFYPVNRKARMLFCCPHEPDAKIAAKNGDRSCSGVDTRNSFAPVCERLRGIDGAAGGERQEMPEELAGACPKCPAGSFPTEAAAVAAAAAAGWEARRCEGAKAGTCEGAEMEAAS